MPRPSLSSWFFHPNNIWWGVRIMEVRGGVVGWCTALEAGKLWFRFPIVSLEFFIYIILPAALRPWGRLGLQKKWVPGIYSGGQRCRCVGLTNFQLHVPIFSKSGSLNLREPYGPVLGLNRDSFILITDHKAPHYVVFSTLLLLRPTWKQISSAPILKQS